MRISTRLDAKPWDRPFCSRCKRRRSQVRSGMCERCDAQEKKK